MSLCPFRYLVTEWSATSAPRSSGRWKYGVMKVLSTTTLIPRRRARSLTAAMSVSSIMGLVGVSTTTMRVSGRKARSTASVSAALTNVKVRPRRRSTFSNRR